MPTLVSTGSLTITDVMDGKDAVYISLSALSWTASCAVDGTVLSWTGAESIATVMEGGAAGTGWNYATPTTSDATKVQGVWTAATRKFQLQVFEKTLENGWVEFTATKGAVTLTARMALSKAKVGTPATTYSIEPSASPLVREYDSGNKSPDLGLWALTNGTFVTNETASANQQALEAKASLAVTLASPTVALSIGTWEVSFEAYCVGVATKALDVTIFSGSALATRSVTLGGTAVRYTLTLASSSSAMTSASLRFLATATAGTARIFNVYLTKLKQPPNITFSSYRVTGAGAKENYLGWLKVLSTTYAGVESVLYSTGATAETSRDKVVTPPIDCVSLTAQLHLNSAFTDMRDSETVPLTHRVGPVGPPVTGLSLAADSYFFKYDKDNVLQSAATITITLTGDSNLNATWSALLFAAGATTGTAVTLGAGSAANIKTLTSAQFGSSVRAEIKASIGAYEKTITIQRAQDGEAVVAVGQSNGTHVLTCDNGGNVQDYTGSGNTIQVRLGTSETLQYETGTGNPTGDKKYKVVATGSGITPNASPSVSGKDCVYGVAAGMAAVTNSATITYSVVVQVKSVVTTYSVVQSFSKSKAGATGYSVILSNEAHPVPFSGSTADLTNSGTQVLVYKDVQLGTTANTGQDYYRITGVTGSGVTVATWAATSTALAAHTAWTATGDTASVTITVGIYTSAGVLIASITKVQTLSKSRSGQSLAVSSTSQIIKGTASVTPNTFTLTAVTSIPATRLRWQYSNTQGGTPVWNALAGLNGLASFTVGSNIANITGGLAFPETDSIQRWKVYDVDDATLFDTITIARISDGAAGGPGAAGVRGSIHFVFNTSVTGVTYSATTWNSGATIDGYVTGTYGQSQGSGGVVVNGDVVTLVTMSTNYAQTAHRRSGAWYFLASYINGDELVDGTIFARKLEIGFVSRNLLHNSGPIVNNQTDGWQAGYNNTNLTVTVGGGFSPWFPTGRASVYATTLGTAASGTNFDLSSSKRIPVQPYGKYEVSAYFSLHGCNADVAVAFFNQAGNYVSESHVGYTSVQTASGALSQWPRGGGIVTAPSTAAYAQFFCRAYPTGAFQPYMFVTHAYFGPALPDQSASNLSPWAPPTYQTIIDGDGIRTNTVYADKIVSRSVANLQRTSTFLSTVIGGSQTYTTIAGWTSSSGVYQHAHAEKAVVRLLISITFDCPADTTGVRLIYDYYTGTAWNSIIIPVYERLNTSYNARTYSANLSVLTQVPPGAGRQLYWQARQQGVEWKSNTILPQVAVLESFEYISTTWLGY